MDKNNTFESQNGYYTSYFSTLVLLLLVSCNWHIEGL